ncbi:Glyoxylase, beta-lactamase superfamily II [Fontimonas thermophila]|uniref:Glyoxylase, beta-lactamase superfamily II n=1 Tax=Fontimonas thermophila TaxID=1076937 RepID=A0A1I2JDU5_9GAMM|nr:MBL fold metallo-hydrolase [Fontimonas thermophila]SFF52724.1 Glyoxylase, beta-lactamase superfamily II [Fontimonas thermophila]
MTHVIDAESAHAPTAGGLQYPCGTPPSPGTAVEVAPGVLWLRMPLPLALDHINLWALADDEGWTLVDSGLNTEATAAAWETLLGGALGGKPVRRLICTHMHPDHIGMAGWLAERTGCRLWITRLEYLTCRTLVADTGRPAPEDGVRFYRAAGWNDEQLARYRERFGSFGRGIYRLPDSFRRLSDGERLRIGAHEWTVVVGRGHSPEHACLYCAGLDVLISGDQVLPRISSNVSVFPTEPDADPLGDWLDSLDRLSAAIPDSALVLPAHNEPFRGLHARLASLREGHTRSLDRLYAALDSPQRAVDLLGLLFRKPLRGEHYLMATGECLAHLNWLLRRGRIEATIDTNGVRWYRRTPPG